MKEELFTLKKIKSRAATMENPNAEISGGGTVNNGRKGAPCKWPLKAGEVHELLNIKDSGMIRHIWCTIPPGNPLHLRNIIIRMYWDGQEQPSVEAPLGDFFGIAHGRQKDLLSELLYMQAGKGFNCWIPMPFQKGARITIENDSGTEVAMFFYQVDFTTGDEIEDNAGYFHAQFRRQNPCPLYKDYTILDGIEGQGVYLGTVLGVRALTEMCWWGEGEVKFFIDDDDKFPTICGTGAEDYIGAAWGLPEHTTPIQGAPYVNNKLKMYSMYRFHQKDPIYFQDKLKVTVQQIGMGDRKNLEPQFGDKFVEYVPAGEQKNKDAVYFESSDDWSSVAYWYQTLPTKAFPTLPNREQRSADLRIDEEKSQVKRDDV